MNLIFTDQAAAAVLQFQAENAQWKGLPVRVYLSGKGCDGFEYGVCFDGAIEQDDKRQIDARGFEIICDAKTLSFVDGSTVDFADDERGRGFIVQNPSHRKFRGKFFNKKSWQAENASKLQQKSDSETHASP
jgi:iron-sulfur cluster insertion protein